MNNTVIKFDVFHGRCAKCDAPVYFSSVIDWEGNKVTAFHCWNGHYEHIEIDTFDLSDVKDDLTPEHIEEILPFVGFIRVKGERDEE